MQMKIYNQKKKMRWYRYSDREGMKVFAAQYIISDSSDVVMGKS